MTISGLSRIEKRLISIAAAIAAGCKPCTAITIRQAKEVGASEEEIKRAVEIGLQVKQKACDEIQQEAHKHLDFETTDFSTDEITCHSKSDWLIAAVAAFATNSTTGFDHNSASAEKLGATMNELKMAIEIAHYVKEQAGIQVNRKVAEVLPIELNAKIGTNGCGCSNANND